MEFNCGSVSSAIQEVYRGANIFITGGTGFMGKVLVEKLLRACPNIGNIYLLIRSKRGNTVDQRIDQMTNMACFDRLRSERPEFRTQLIAVSGDISEEHLGISDEDCHLLAYNVNIVFHLAASVNFNQQLTLAIKQNVRATRDLLLMCKTFNNLKSIIHLSTAYSNCPLQEIKEVYYDHEVPISSDLAINIAENMEENIVEAITPILIGKWPNTYTYTKYLAEDVVKKYGKDLAVAVIRPTIVTGTAKEPMFGWVDTLNGPTGVIAGYATGMFRTMQCDLTMQANLVPCDMVINGVIAAAWDIHQRRSTSPPVYNFSKPDNNSFTWEDFLRMIVKHWSRVPFSRAMWHPSFLASKGKLQTMVYRFLLHTCPALLIDSALRITGNKPRMIRTYSRTNQFADVLAYFSTRQWSFQDSNVVEMWNRMSLEDRVLLPLDMRTLNYEKYMRETCLGIREHLLKDGPETLQAARTRYLRFYWLNFTVTTLMYGTLTMSFVQVLLRVQNRLYL